MTYFTLSVHAPSSRAHVVFSFLFFPLGTLEAQRALYFVFVSFCPLGPCPLLPDSTAIMPSLIDSLGNFVSSIFGAITAVFSSILAVFQSLVTTVFGIIQTAFAAVGTMISGLAQTFEGLLKFLLSNIVVIGGIVGALFLYGVYQQRNGKPITAAPATKKVN